MAVCCCSLAGTAACRYCMNNPNAETPPPIRTATVVATDNILISGIGGTGYAPVVRCGECKWYERKTSECHNPRYGNGWANYPPPSVNDEYYCADGERKDGADDDNDT